jgi:hypothetical protein
LILCDQFGDVPSYPLDGHGFVLVGLFSYPLEVIDQCIFNVLLGFSFDHILIPNIQFFFMRSSCDSCPVKKLGVPLPSLRHLILGFWCHKVSFYLHLSSHSWIIWISSFFRSSVYPSSMKSSCSFVILSSMLFVPSICSQRLLCSTP